MTEYFWKKRRNGLSIESYRSENLSPDWSECLECGFVELPLRFRQGCSLSGYLGIGGSDGLALNGRRGSASLGCQHWLQRRKTACSVVKGRSFMGNERNTNRGGNTINCSVIFPRNTYLEFIKLRLEVLGARTEVNMPENTHFRSILSRRESPRSVYFEKKKG